MRQTLDNSFLNSNRNINNYVSWQLVMLMLTASTGRSSPANKNLQKMRESLPAEKQTLSRWKQTLTWSRWWWQASWSLFYCHLGEPRGYPRVQPCFHWSQLWPLTRRSFFFVVFIRGSLQDPYCHLLDWRGRTRTCFLEIIGAFYW